jgi:hypothetical protein
MMPKRAELHKLATAAALVFLSYAPLARAAGAYDGNWVIDFPAVGGNPAISESGCQALRLPLEIKDSKFASTLARVPAPTGGVVVEAGRGTDSASITGTVQADGNVSADWERYHVTGQLAGNSGQLEFKGECGVRVGQAVRVTN